MGSLAFDPGFDIRSTGSPLGFCYGPGVFGPEVELRRLGDIRASLRDPGCQGPDVVYAISMDTGHDEDRSELLQHNLLFGAVTYAKGTMGEEPVHSQGHVHAVSPSCGERTCEVYEIWDGEAFVYLQERVETDPGVCVAVHAAPGDVVIVPPGWAHSTVVADVGQNLTFGAWCVRDYGFDYEGVRAHHGMAWTPVVDHEGEVRFEANPSYEADGIAVVEARAYPEFGIEAEVPVYRQFEGDPGRFDFVADPRVAAELWHGLEQQLAGLR
ncbi:MAG: glucose-6-phosphate isomerase family protein [Olsenella sp.]